MDKDSAVNQVAAVTMCAIKRQRLMWAEIKGKRFIPPELITLEDITGVIQPEDFTGDEWSRMLAARARRFFGAPED